MVKASTAKGLTQNRQSDKVSPAKTHQVKALAANLGGLPNRETQTEIRKGIHRTVKVSMETLDPRDRVDLVRELGQEGWVQAGLDQSLVGRLTTISAAQS